MKATSSRYMLLGIVLGLLLALGAAAVWLAQPYAYQGSLIDPPAPAADFTLTDHDRQPFRLSEQRGKVVVLFFGYTHCPDVCPATLASFQQITQELDAQAGGVTFVFVSVDPERDTPDALRAHVGYFKADIHGLTGTRAELEPVYQNYSVTAQKVETGTASEYVINHTARTYVIDKDGNLRLTYPFGFENKKIVEDLRHLIEE